MAKKKKKTIKIEIPVPEPLQDIRKPKAEDLDKIKESIPTTEEIKRSLPKRLPNKDDAYRLKDYICNLYREYPRHVMAAVVIVAAIIVVGFFLSYQPPAADTGGPAGPTKVNRTKVVTVTVPVNLSFGEYLENYVEYEDAEISVIGFIKRDIKWGMGGGTMGTYTYAVVDDFGNELNLTELSARQKTMFPDENMSESLYRVTGMVRLKFRGFDLEVSSINEVNRPETQVQRTIVVEEYA
jgi:hypothetical protein